MTYFNAQKDANSVSTLCGISSVDGKVIPIQIDPVSGRVLVKVTVVSNDSPVLYTGRAAKDANSTSTILALASDLSGVIVPAIYQGNAQLFVDIA